MLEIFCLILFILVTTSMNPVAGYSNDLNKQSDNIQVSVHNNPPTTQEISGIKEGNFGEVIDLSHSWYEKGSYGIRAKTKDTFGDETFGL